MEPDRFDYSPIIDRPVLRWPNGARVALWVSPNVEHYEYTPPTGQQRNPWPRTPHPDVLNYANRDYGNRVGFWRLVEVLDKHQVPCTVSLNVAILEHFPEVREAMVARNWAFMSHGIYNTRYLYGMPEEEERAFYQDTIETVMRYTGKQIKGMLGPAVSNSVNTPDLMAEAGLLYHADWLHDDQPFPLKVKQGRLISMPYSIEINDAIMVYEGFEADYLCQIIKAQFDVLYREGEKDGRVMCIALHPYLIGQPHRLKYLDEALSYVLAHDGVWLTTADDIAEYYMANYYDSILAYLEEPKG